MEEIIIHKKIDIINPVMIAGWPGMGSVASGVVSYLRRKLKAVKFAEISVDPLSMLDSVAVEGGFANFPPPPQNLFYYSRNPDMIIFEGESQSSGPAGIALLGKVLDLALQFKTRMIYTGAAFPLPVSHKETPHIYGAVNSKTLANQFSKFNITPMDGGHISGLNGLLLGFAKEKGINAMCLLATMPQYAISLPNPKASYAIIEALQRIALFKVDMLELAEQVKDMDEKMVMIEDKVKDALIFEKEDNRGSQAHLEKKIPAYIVEKIEKLFQDAKADKAKAIILKKELDRWDLYHRYEDRFLDLFKNRK